tara:strand:- start:2210 stop:3475 length:1266 start_codon:yes stop_codon:yes gene_type:complete
MSKKIKVLTLGDHPLSPSGVGTQTKYVCEALLNTGKFSIVSLGGAIRHHDYTPKLVEPYGEDWKAIPIDGYGNPEMIRSVLRNEKPDILWFMTDPRFYGWLWSIENEIRPLCPMVYYHVWDNYPYPMFNKKFYESNDYVITISKLTDDIVKTVAPSIPSTYLPHAVDSEKFVSLSLEDRVALREQNLEKEDVDKFIVFWNNRNARRKQSGTLIFWFKEWLDSRDLHGDARLIMHTDPKDPHGQDLSHILEELGLVNGEVMFSTKKVPAASMATFYNIADVTVNIADAEGFGLATLESLSCGTPIIATMTGGLQEQVVGEGEVHGVPLFPSSKAIIGSQDVPYIYEDRLNKEDFIAAMDKIYDMSKEDRLALGAKGREHVQKNYNFENFNKQWVDLMLKIYEDEGSWDTRKNYSTITFKEVA